ncbi:hypothetical protein LX32DRAFT_26900 [Colletotrichum zoysiae]|uniref:Uncharacterized protein n=1 Tax=Colletotrichum zoysiae TaxID=1216348 RepID=A0AAD9M5B1_9PEZI|nr:hypothetical protein LX32DRAFT_26900 [Colletotrichum zoysiae]
MPMRVFQNTKWRTSAMLRGSASPAGTVNAKKAMVAVTGAIRTPQLLRRSGWEPNSARGCRDRCHGRSPQHGIQPVKTTLWARAPRSRVGPIRPQVIGVRD